MNRIEKVREVVDEILLHMTDIEERRCAYLHLYGVSQACALLALKRREDVELATIAGMLHDIYSYANMNPLDHAHKGAEMAREILDSVQAFSEEEKDLICTAIYYHSDKAEVHGWLDEILKDADVMQHVLYNPMLVEKQKEPKRYCLIKKEFGLEDVLYLKPMTADMYHEYFKEYQNDLDLYIDKSTYVAYVYDEEKVNQYIQRQMDLNRKCFAIMYGNEMVGELIIKNIEEHNCATLGIAMRNVKYKDKGYGTKAELLAIEYVFHELDIPTLYADSILSNTRSQHVLEKVGFRLIKEEGNFKYYCIER